MKIKKIILNNIRSYEHSEVVFPEGSTLLSGDIGSGKTSVLLAIEFALFGLQPGQRGSSLLRNGANEGGVSLEFEVDGKNIFLERTMKRGKSISQDYAAITIDGDKKEISVTELKNRVLQILNYPREFSKKQNILYKFTVYTPQEEMKQIILHDSETRINTLRHVFGIDKYKKILENTATLLSKLREEKRIKEVLVSSLEQEKTLIISKEQDLENKNLNLGLLQKELFEKSELRKKYQEEIEEISKKIEDKNKLQQEIEKTNMMISTKNNSLADNTKIISQLRNQIKEIENLGFDESKITTLEAEIKYLKERKEATNEKNIEVSSKISSLTIQNTGYQKLKDKISKMDVCPTCLQDVDSVYKRN